MIILKFQGEASAPPCPVLPAPMAQADKTKEAVIIDKSVFQQKVQDRFNDRNTYQKHPSNPQFQYRVNRALSKLNED